MHAQCEGNNRAYVYVELGIATHYSMNRVQCEVCMNVLRYKGLHGNHLSSLVPAIIIREGD